MPSKIRGHCLCEAVHFEVTPPTKWCTHCHCSMCRVAHGAPLVTWFSAAVSQFRLVKGEADLKWYASSAGAQRGFCGICGSTMFFQSTRWSGEMHVTRSTVAGAIDRAPDGHAFFDSHVDWLSFDDGLKRFGGDSGTEPLA